MQPGKSINIAKEAIKYYLNSKTIHHIDSPYVFSLVKTILDSDRKELVFESIELLRNRLIQRTDFFKRTDFGSGSQLQNLNEDRVKVGPWVKSSSQHPYYGRLLFRLVSYLQPHHILELGTAADISGAYLASGLIDGNLTTMEGDPFVYQLSKNSFDQLGLSNIRSLQGTFGSLLSEAILRPMCPLDMIYIDGHHDGHAVEEYIHRVQPYLDPSRHTIILDDIRWSDSMKETWLILSRSGRWNISLDLYRMGLLIRTDNKTEFHHGVIAKKFKPLTPGLFR
ncbi:MAG: class I SAM-dependent methyltransferase [Saprospiraceae bacterium]